VNKDFVKIVSEQGSIKLLRLSDIDKKLIQDKKAMSRDGQGNALQLDDVVRVTNRQSSLFDQKGIVKSITKNVLFLWDRNFLTSSHGIFVENPRNTTLCGSEFLHNASNRVKGAGGLLNTNRIQRDKLLNKVVLIINGPFKGQKGRVVHVNGDTATLETSIRAKQVHIPKNDLRDISSENEPRFNEEGDMVSRAGDFEDQMQPAESAYAGNQTTYGGGQTAYDAGKTPLALYTPNYQGGAGGGDNNNNPNQQY
jgi:transcription elongation factor